MSKSANPAPSPDLSGEGMYLGQYRHENGQAGQALLYGGDRHLILFGPSGSGKGSRCLVPNLLGMSGGSVIVVDPKGELAAITAVFRSTVSDVKILNPFGVLDMPSAGFNPLATLDPNCDTFFDDAAGIGEALIKTEDKDPHWSESARALITALVMWEVQLARREQRAPLLTNVRQMLTEPDEYERDAGGKSRQVRGLRVTAARICEQGGYEAESLIGRFVRDSDEMASIISTADRQTAWLLSRPVRADLAKDGIDFADLKRRPTTVYLVLPAERMQTHSVWLRLAIVTALRSLYTPGGLPVLVMLDEFAALGHLAAIEDAFGLVRGYGVQLWPILQDLNQLKALYKDRWETFLANAGVVMGFAPNDLTTAEWMSRRAGDTTVVAASFNQGGEIKDAGQPTNEGLSYQQARRRLFLPQELMDLPEGGGLLWLAGSSSSIPFTAPAYWDQPNLVGLAQPNPYHRPRG